MALKPSSHVTFDKHYAGCRNFAVYQIMAAPTRVARSDDVRRINSLEKDDHMMTKQRFVSLACAGGFAGIFPNAIRTAATQTFRTCWWASVPEARST